MCKLQIIYYYRLCDREGLSKPGPLLNAPPTLPITAPLLGRRLEGVLINDLTSEETYNEGKFRIRTRFL